MTSGHRSSPRPGWQTPSRCLTVNPTAETARFDWITKPWRQADEQTPKSKQDRITW